MFSFLKKSSSDAKPEIAADAAPAEAAKPSWRERLFKGLAKTRAQWGGKLKSIFSRGKVDDELLEELETLLLTSDCGIEATTHLLDELKKAAKRDKLDTPEAIQKALADALLETLQPLEQPLDYSTHKPYVIMIAGVNGAGKTTSIGKLAKYFQTQGKSVLLAAGDTFRAAAREQLQTWGERNNVTVVAQESGDPAAVQREAHTVKSVCATFSFESGRELAFRLEQLAAAGNLNGADVLTAELLAAIDTLAGALKA